MRIVVRRMRTGRNMGIGCEGEAEQVKCLELFVRWQGAEEKWARILAELTAGKKETHWMWYVFPQMRGLARSRKAFVFGIVDIEEARAYLAHPLLGSRLRVCSEKLLAHTNKTAVEIFGELDAMKLRSCMTLFAAASEECSVFHKVLQQFFGGKKDPLTEGLLSGRVVDVTPLKYQAGGQSAFYAGIRR